LAFEKGAFNPFSTPSIYFYQLHTEHATKSLRSGQHGEVYYLKFQGHACAAKAPKRKDNRLRFEAHVLAVFEDCPYICRSYGLFHIPGLGGDVLVLEYLPRTLGQLADLEELPARAKLLPIIWDITQAPLEAHSRGFLHHDVKLDNIMVTEQYRAKLIDFETACVRLSAADKKANKRLNYATSSTPHPNM